MGGPFWGPDSGSPANLACYAALADPGDLRGPRGGMILCRAELADRIDRAVFPFLQGGPMMHVIAAKAVALGEALEIAGLLALAVREPAPCPEVAATVASLSRRFPAYPREPRRA